MLFSRHRHRHRHYYDCRYYDCRRRNRDGTALSFRPWFGSGRHQEKVA
jgi:hypothetical protein